MQANHATSGIVMHVMAVILLALIQLYTSSKTLKGGDIMPESMGFPFWDKKVMDEVPELEAKVFTGEPNDKYRQPTVEDEITRAVVCDALREDDEDATRDTIDMVGDD